MQETMFHCHVAQVQILYMCNMETKPPIYFSGICRIRKQNHIVTIQFWVLIEYWFIAQPKMQMKIILLFTDQGGEVIWPFQ